MEFGGRTDGPPRPRSSFPLALAGVARTITVAAGMSALWDDANRPGQGARLTDSSGRKGEAPAPVFGCGLFDGGPS